MGVKSTDKSPKGFGQNKVLDQHMVHFYRSDRVGKGVARVSNLLSVSNGSPFTPGDGYQYYAFLSPGIVQVLSDSATIEYLVVAGGGGGGSSIYSGGGGGGGFRTGSSILPNGIYPVTIGDGGPVGSQGSSSSFGPIISVGGGKGGNAAVSNDPGGSGGSGGGGSYSTGNGGAAQDYPGPNQQGYPGGPAVNIPSSYNCTGGGGGAGEIGQQGLYGSGLYGSGGRGGGGATSPGWDIPASYGTTGPTPGRWFAGGGGGGSINSAGSSAGAGSPSGGGGRGHGGAVSDTPNQTSQAGTINTGGGGGGSSNPASAPGGASPGGPGIVIIRYLV